MAARRDAIMTGVKEGKEENWCATNSGPSRARCYLQMVSVEGRLMVAKARMFLESYRNFLCKFDCPKQQDYIFQNLNS